MYLYAFYLLISIEFKMFVNKQVLGSKDYIEATKKDELYINKIN